MRCHDEVPQVDCRGPLTYSSGPPGTAHSTSAAPDIETASDDYAKRFSGPVGEWFLSLQTRHVRDLLAPRPACRIIDVGGGHAQLAIPLAEAGYDVTVVGSDPTCRRRLDAHRQSHAISFTACALDHLPFPDQSFDVALAFRLLAHFADWRQLIRELCRVARWGVIIDYPDRRSFNFIQDRFFRWKLSVEGNTRPFRCFRRADIVSLFSQLGFPEITARPQFFWPMALHRALQRKRISQCAESCARAGGLQRLFGSPVILRACRTAALSSHRADGPAV